MYGLLGKGRTSETPSTDALRPAASASSSLAASVAGIGRAVGLADADVAKISADAGGVASQRGLGTELSSTMADRISVPTRPIGSLQAQPDSSLSSPPVSSGKSPSGLFSFVLGPGSEQESFSKLRDFAAGGATPQLGGAEVGGATQQLYGSYPLPASMARTDLSASQTSAVTSVVGSDIAPPGIAAIGQSRLGGSGAGASGRGSLVSHGQAEARLAQMRSLASGSANVSASAPPGTPSLLSHETRVCNLETRVKKFDQMIKEYRPPERSDSDMLKAMQRCESLAAELAEQRKNRKALEERVKQLDKLLRHEKGEREAWLVAFLTSLHTTLKELTGCIDRSLSDSNLLMKNSMDGTDEVMHRLFDRVDQLLIQKESELAPLLERDEP